MEETPADAPKIEILPEEVPVLRLTFDESRKLMQVAERYRRDNPMFYLTQSVGLAGLLDDILRERAPRSSILYEDDSAFRCIAEKIKALFNDDGWVDWRYVEFPKDEGNLDGVLTQWIENAGRPLWIDRQTGEQKVDPLPGACIGGDYAEGYAHHNKEERPFVFFAYDISRMGNAPMSWSKHGLINRRLIPPGLPTEPWEDLSPEDQEEYHRRFAERFRGAIVFQFDIQIPTFEVLEERIHENMKDILLEAIEKSRAAAEALHAKGVQYTFDVNSLGLSLCNNLDRFMVLLKSICDTPRRNTGNEFLQRIAQESNWVGAFRSGVDQSFTLFPPQLDALDEVLEVPRHANAHLMQSVLGVIHQVVREYNPPVEGTSLASPSQTAVMEVLNQETSD